MKFAKVEESAIKQHLELTGEELRLYVLIKFHTWNDSGVCNKTLRELCEIHGLNYDHTTTRYKSLRTKGWCEKTKKRIRPLVDIKTSKSEVSKTSKSEVNENEKLQNRKFKTSKSEVNEGEKLQNRKFVYKEYTEPLKSRDSSDNNNIEKTDAVSSSSSSKNLSQFSPEECLRYIEIRIANGEKLETPHRLARWAHQTGEMDAFILATLYPEQIQTQQIIVEQQIEYDDNFEHFDARSFAEEWAETLEYLRELGADVSERRSNYAPEIWARLMEALNG